MGQPFKRANKLFEATGPLPPQATADSTHMKEGVNTISDEPDKEAAQLIDYLSMTRPGYWLKNIFVLPGLVFAMALYQPPFSWTLLFNVIVGLISCTFIVSANYVINEYFDRGFDKYHPLKHIRVAVVRTVNPAIVFAFYILLAFGGMALGSLVSDKFFVAAGLLLFMGLVYNVKPIRSKERVYLDVLTESINNPLRFLLGWFMVPLTIGNFPDNRWDLEFFDTIPPFSIIVAYWMGGAFLMATKRFAEYRLIGNPEIAGLYRKSFKYYSENSLLITMFFLRDYVRVFPWHFPDQEQD